MTDEKRDALIEQINDYFDNECDTSKLIEINNRWYDETCDGYMIDEMGDFDEHYGSRSPSDIADAVTGGNYDSCDDYFVDDGYCHTFCDPTDWIEFSDLIDYIVDNENDLGDSHIRKLLEEANNEEDETIILIHPTYGEDIAIGKEEFRIEHDNEADMFFTESNEVMTGADIVEWLDEHGGDELVLTEFTLEKYLERNGFRERRTVCMHEGILFGDDTCYDDGRYFQWFYCPTNGLLLKLYLDNPSHAEILYIKEVFGLEGILDMYRLIKRYIH